jgi:hypothetical protein
MIAICLFLAAASACPAQWFAVGMKGGARVTGDVAGWATSESKRYAVAPAVELLLPYGFGLEFNALYSRFGYRSARADLLGGSYVTVARANVWEFPILGKKRIGPIYGLIGYAPRRMTGSAHTHGSNVLLGGPRRDYDYTGELPLHTTHGVVAGGGMEFARGRFRITPEVRYTRWNRDPIDMFGSRGFFIAGPQNEVKFLLGLWRR